MNECKVGRTWGAAAAARLLLAWPVHRAAWGGARSNWLRHSKPEGPARASTVHRDTGRRRVVRFVGRARTRAKVRGRERAREQQRKRQGGQTRQHRQTESACVYARVQSGVPRHGSVSTQYNAAAWNSRTHTLARTPAKDVGCALLKGNPTPHSHAAVPRAEGA